LSFPKIVVNRHNGAIPDLQKFLNRNEGGLPDFEAREGAGFREIRGRGESIGNSGGDWVAHGGGGVGGIVLCAD
jgi:hypothetical protein